MLTFIACILSVIAGFILSVVLECMKYDDLILEINELNLTINDKEKAYEQLLNVKKGFDKNV